MTWLLLVGLGISVGYNLLLAFRLERQLREASMMREDIEQFRSQLINIVAKNTRRRGTRR